MAHKTLAEMRAKLKAQEDRKGGNNSGSGDKTSYPFWDIPLNSTARIRYLPDADNNNDFFWRERAMIRMPFPGIKGDDTQKPINIQVPCMKMYGKTCPVTEEIRDWWKGSDDDQALARTYYRKLSYLYQGFVLESPFKEEEVPENPIRKFVVNPKLHDKTKAAFTDPEIEDLVIDYKMGRDLRITKTKGPGDWDSYDTSKFSNNSRALTDDELAAIEKFGLHNLSSFLPKEPDEDVLKQIMGMFEDSLAHQAFDPDKYPAFRVGGQGGNKNTQASAPKAAATKAQPAAKASKPEPVEEDSDEEQAPVVQKLVSKPAEDISSNATPAAKPTKTAQEVLAMLKQKQNKG